MPGEHPGPRGSTPVGDGPSSWAPASHSSRRRSPATPSRSEHSRRLSARISVGPPAATSLESPTGNRKTAPHAGPGLRIADWILSADDGAVKGPSGGIRRLSCKAGPGSKAAGPATPAPILQTPRKFANHQRRGASKWNRSRHVRPNSSGFLIPASSTWTKSWTPSNSRSALQAACSASRGWNCADAPRRGARWRSQSAGAAFREPTMRGFSKCFWAD